MIFDSTTTSDLFNHFRIQKPLGKTQSTKKHESYSLNP